MGSSDVTSVIKYFSTAAEGFSTTTSGSLSPGATSVGLNSTTGLTNGAVFVGIIEPGVTAQQTFTGTVDVSGSQIANVVWVRGTNVGHAGGVTVVDYVSGASHSMMTAGILKHASQDGTLLASAVDNAIAAGSIDTAQIADSSVTTAKIADASVTNAKLATSAGEIGAAWQSYTPTWTNVTVGNATQSFRYIQVGKKVTFQGSIVLGSTSSVSGLIVLTVPVTMSSNASNTHINLGAGQFNRPAVAGYIATVIPINTTTIQFAIPNGVSDTRLSNADSTHPWSSWTTGDNIGFTITYEAA